MSCFSSCFMGSVVHDYDPVSSIDGSKSKSMRFSWWRRGKRKNKTVPVDTNPTTREEDKVHKQRKKSQPQQQQQVPVTGSQTVTLPTISPKYSARNGPTIVTGPVDQAGTAAVHSAAGRGREEHLDPVVGLSVMVITLSTLLAYGRVCAVFCLCACFYLVPLFLTTKTTTIAEAKDKAVRTLDVNSEEYKKKVILEGLLERNRLKPTVAAALT